MATEAQILANRENAKKSTGAVTEAGKRASSRNSTIHGIFIAVPSLDEEEQEQLHTLYKTLSQDFVTVTLTEGLIVWSMTVAHFRLQRAIETEKAYYVEDRVRYEADPSNTESWTPASAYKRLTASGDLQRLTRYQRGFERTWEKKLAELRRLQADRAVRDRREKAASTEVERERSLSDADQLFRDAPSLDSFPKELITDVETQLAEFRQRQKRR